jgi:hypothetical protein
MSLERMACFLTSASEMCFPVMGISLVSCKDPGRRFTIAWDYGDAGGAAVKGDSSCLIGMGVTTVVAENTVDRLLQNPPIHAVNGRGGSRTCTVASQVGL